MMKKNKIFFEELEHWVSDLIHEKAGMFHKLQRVCKLLIEEVAHYDWVGFYFVDKENPEELILGAFEGAPTEHTRIHFGQGICGQVAEDWKTRIIQDVTKEDNYLSCSINVKSEIVLPIFKSGKFIGEIDIDSHKTVPFTDEDEIFLVKIAEKASKIF